MDVGVDTARGDDAALAGDDLSAGADRDRHIGLGVRIAGLADRPDTAGRDRDVGLDDAPVVDDQRVGDDGIRGAVGIGQLALTHAVADGLAAAELDLLAIDRVVPFDFDEQLGIGEADAIADGRAIHVRVFGAGDARHRQGSSGPATSLRNP